MQEYGEGPSVPTTNFVDDYLVSSKKFGDLQNLQEVTPDEINMLVQNTIPISNIYKQNCKILDVRLHIGGFFYSKKSIYDNNDNVIIFDLDETLGSFTDLDILWRKINKKISFNKLLDLFPEFFRYGIFSIIKYIYLKKKNKECEKIFIYTNNKSSCKMVYMICDYFIYKLNAPDLFDQIIGAYKISNNNNNNQNKGNNFIEDCSISWKLSNNNKINRTTHNKTHSDFIRCTLLPKKTKICFIDDTIFENMISRRIYYIQPMVYHHHLSKEEILNRISHLLTDLNEKNEIFNDLATFSDIEMNKYNDYLLSKKNLDKIVAHKLMYHIKDFFYLTRKHRNTKKIINNYNKMTRKKYK
jgi:hypothetical protein